MRRNAQYIFLTIKAKNGEILNTLKVTRSVRDVVEKYVMQRRILMIVIAARRVTTRIIGNPAAVLSAPRKSLFLSKMQVMLPRCLDRFFLLFTYTCYCADAEEEEKHPLIVVRAIYCQKNKT